MVFEKLFLQKYHDDSSWTDFSCDRFENSFLRRTFFVEPELVFAWLKIFAVFYFAVKKT